MKGGRFKMKRKFLCSTIFGFVVVLATAITAFALPIAQPSDLPLGAEYRLAFVTNSKASASSTDITVYNSFVTTQAESSSVLLALATTWTAIASTPTVYARDNTNTDWTVTSGVPIYNLNGQRIANDYADLWDGVLLNAILYDQFGNPVNDHTYATWTGTATSGEFFGGHALGEEQPRLAFDYQTNQQWINAGNSLSNTIGRHFYGMSSTLTVVPEPTTMLLLGSGLIGLAGFRRKFKKK